MTVQLNDRDADAVADILTRFAEMLEAPMGDRRRDAMAILIGWAGETVSAHRFQAQRIRAIAEQITMQRGAA
jgi:hypothetical protein